MGSRLVWHPFSQMQTSFPIPIKRAEGLYLYGEDGTSYMDAISSWWVNLHGHLHPYIVSKIKEQLGHLEQVIFAGFTHSPAEELAAKLLPLFLGKMSKIFYSDNGSTAVEVALKMALHYWYHKKEPRVKVVCFNKSYHGDTFGAMSVAGKNGFNRPFWSHLFDVLSIDPPIQGEEERSLSQMKFILEKERVACFIFEPLILGAGGMIIYPKEPLDALLSLCKEHGVLLIADEVMTGFGRTSTLFATSELSVPVDLICLSKGITGGFLPLGATLATEEIYQAFLGENLSQAFLHGHSYTANSLSCASASASLDLLLEAKCSENRDRIALSHKHFCAKWRGHPKLKRVESIGTILVLEYDSEKGSYFHSSYFHSLGPSLYSYFLKKGILVRPLGNVLYLIPPYCITQKELDYIYLHIHHHLES